MAKETHIEQSIKHHRIALFAILGFIALLTYLVITISQQVQEQAISTEPEALTFRDNMMMDESMIANETTDRDDVVQTCVVELENLRPITGSTPNSPCYYEGYAGTCIIDGKTHSLQEVGCYALNEIEKLYQDAHSKCASFCERTSAPGDTIPRACYDPATICGTYGSNQLLCTDPGSGGQFGCSWDGSMCGF